jgi:hypothetical protein
MQLNAINSPLLRLPAELRNRIFTYVFSGEEYRFLGNERGPITCRISSFQHNGLGPLLVSRQLYIETAILPYKLGTFRFMFDDCYSEKEWSWYVKRLLENRPTAQIKAITSLQATEVSWGGPQWIWDMNGVGWVEQLSVW